jgi:hypothetical protein
VARGTTEGRIFFTQATGGFGLRRGGGSRTGSAGGHAWLLAAHRGPVAAPSSIYAGRQLPVLDEQEEGWIYYRETAGGLGQQGGGGTRGSKSGGAAGLPWLRCGLGRRRLGLVTLTAPLICSRLGLWLGRATAQAAGPLAGLGDRTGCWARWQGRPVGPAAHQSGLPGPADQARPHGPDGPGGSTGLPAAMRAVAMQAAWVGP